MWLARLLTNQDNYFDPKGVHIREVPLHVYIPHTHHSGFHMTLATYCQPVQLAMKKINKMIPPQTWHSTPIILDRPVCRNLTEEDDPIVGNLITSEDKSPVISHLL